MNRENIQKVRDHIAGLPDEQFDMTDPRTPRGCGSAACIGGWTNAIVGGKGAIGMDHAGKLLGLRSRVAEELFYPGSDVVLPEGCAPFRATPADAVRVLDHLLETGEVDWSIIDAPSPSSDRGGS